MQVARTRYAAYSIAYHFVWIPKYRRKVLVRQVQLETKRLIQDGCERHGGPMDLPKIGQPSFEVICGCRGIFVKGCPILGRFVLGLTLLEIETDIDHVHVFVSAPPRFSPSQIANLLKGYSSRYLRERFPHLKKAYGQEQLWTQSYYIGTAGSVSAEVIRR